jgi:phosphate starvation-inducible PhoH-like protein
LCIQVAAEDSLYVTDDFLVTHNTLNDAFVILDEAQNTTAEQMKMFLTRLGFGSKIVVTGDVTQVDLPGGAQSGLKIVREILDGIEDVHFANLTSADVVRHRLVGNIVDAYERWDASQQHARPTSGAPVRTSRTRRQGS